MAFKIKWMSRSQWVGTETDTNVEETTYETREGAEKALAEMQADQKLMDEVHYAAVEAQGVEGWLEIAADDDD